MIPRLIHLVWIGDAVPDWVDNNADSFRSHNPTFSVILHRGADAILPFYAQYLPDCLCPAMVSDLIRLSLLEVLGGWYVDADMRCTRSLLREHEIAERDISCRIGVVYRGGAEVPNTPLVAPVPCHAWPYVRKSMASVDRSSYWAFGGKTLMGLWADDMLYRLPTGLADYGGLPYIQAVAGQYSGSAAIVHK